MSRILSYIFLIKVVSICAALVYANAQIGINTKESRAKDIVVTVTTKKSDVYLSEECMLNVQIKNTSQRSITIPHPDTPSSRNCLVLWILFKGEPESSRWTSPSSTYANENGVDATEKLVLAPGAACTANIPYTPMVPGKVLLGISYETKRLHTAGYSDRDGKFVIIDDGMWQGTVMTAEDVIVTVRPELPETMRVLYAKMQKDLDDSALPIADKRAILKTVAAHRHYVAANFILDYYHKTTDPALKAIALQYELDLLDYGTAVEFIPEALELLTKPNTPTATRTRILDRISTMNLDAKTATLEIQYQACYTVHGKLFDTLLKQVQTCVKDDDLEVAQRAEQIIVRIQQAVERMDKRILDRTPATTTQPKTP